MEGAVVAKIAYHEKIPSIVLRVISDYANEKSLMDFTEFLEIYEKYALKFIESLLYNMVNNRI